MKVLMVGGYPGDGWISIGRYQRELAQGLSSLRVDQPLEIASVVPHPGRWVSRLFSTGRPGRSLASYWSRLVTYPRQLRKTPSTVCHILNQSLSHLVDGLDPRRTVITCHDLLHFPLWDRRRRYSVWPWATDKLYRFCVGKLSQSAAVIAVSQTNKEDAIRYLGCKPERITVIHEGVSLAFFQPVAPEAVSQLRAQLHLGEGPVLLHVGLPTFYKNIEGLLEAFAFLQRKWGGKGTLIRVGPEMPASQKRLAHRLGVAGSVREAGIHGDDTLPSFYHLADCFIFPSFYEGFGFPPLEAMACGLPVVASNRGSLPEILGTAALRVDPENSKGIAEAARMILEDAKLREDLRQRGLAQSKRFRWEEAARKTFEIYESVAAKK